VQRAERLGITGAVGCIALCNLYPLVIGLKIALMFMHTRLQCVCLLHNMLADDMPSMHDNSCWQGICAEQVVVYFILSLVCPCKT
jgi:hypothetical protein